MAFRIEHRLGVRAPADRIWRLVEDLPGWSRWNPLYTEAAGAFGFGQSLILTEVLPFRAPRRISPTIVDWTPRELLHWSVQHAPMVSRSLHFFEIDELAPGSCVVANGEIFYGVVGETEAKRHARAIHQAFEQMNRALKAQVEDGPEPEWPEI